MILPELSNYVKLCLIIRFLLLALYCQELILAENAPYLRSPKFLCKVHNKTIDILQNLNLNYAPTTTPPLGCNT